MFNKPLLRKYSLFYTYTKIKKPREKYPGVFIKNPIILIENII